MPEGDTVWYAARRLDEALAGRTLTRTDFRVPRFATADLSGATVSQALARGKHLLIRTADGLSIHTHLRMDGSWRVTAAAEPVRDSHRIRLILANEQWRATGYQLGVVELLRTRDENRVTGHLGPDLLGPTGTQARRSAGSPPIRTGQLPRPCSTSATSLASATCTRRRCCSSVA